MDKASLIYVAGHTGLVGSAIVRQLLQLGYTNILTKPHKDLDLTDRSTSEHFFKKHLPQYVFLTAAKVGGILANNTYPAHFIYQNIMIQTNVIDLAHKHGVRKLLFLGCPCIYPKMCPQPIKEEYLLSGYIEPTNEPYAVAKISGIKMCWAYNAQYGTNFISAIPANLYGINDHFDDSGHVVASLIRKFHEAKMGRSKQDSVTIWGTGKPRREFLCVDDVAEACVFLMNTYDSSEIMNIGGDCDISIAELAGIIKKITGFRGRIVYDRSKPGGIPRRILDTSKITALDWKPRTTLEVGLELTYGWYKEKWNRKPSVSRLEKIG